VSGLLFLTPLTLALLFDVDIFFGGNKTDRKVKQKQDSVQHVPSAATSSALRMHSRDLNQEKMKLCIQWLLDVGCEIVSGHLKAYLED
jgi:hypothetical protein